MMNVRAILVRTGAAATGTALLAGAMWLHGKQPEVEADSLDPIRATGRIGQAVGDREFTLKVERVNAARSLAATLSGRPPIGTQGVFLVVGFRATSLREPVRLRSVVLETPDGRSFEAGPRTGTSEPAPPEFQPLIWTGSAFVFEVPKDALAGARLVAGTGGLLPQLSAAAEIDLGITPARAKELIGGAADGLDLRKVRP